MLRSTAPLLAAEGTPPPPQAAWRLGDELDKRIASLALPAVVSFMILPIAQATDLFWVGRMGEALAVASRRLPPPPSVQAQSSQANSNPSPNPYPN